MESFVKTNLWTRPYYEINFLRKKWNNIFCLIEIAFKKFLV